MACVSQITKARPRSLQIICFLKYKNSSARWDFAVNYSGAVHDWLNAVSKQEWLIQPVLNHPAPCCSTPRMHWFQWLFSPLPIYPQYSQGESAGTNNCFSTLNCAQVQKFSHVGHFHLQSINIQVQSHQHKGVLFYLCMLHSFCMHLC